MATYIESPSNANTGITSTTPLTLSTSALSGSDMWLGLIVVYDTTTSGVCKATRNGSDIIPSATTAEQQVNQNFAFTWSIALGDNPGQQDFEFWIEGLTKPVAAACIVYSGVDQSTPVTVNSRAVNEYSPDITFSNASGQAAAALMAFDDGGGTEMPAINQGTERARAATSRAEAFIGETTAQNGTVEWGTGSDLQSYQTDSWWIQGFTVNDATTSTPSVTMTLYSKADGNAVASASIDYAIRNSGTALESAADVFGTDTTDAGGSITISDAALSGPVRVTVEVNDGTYAGQTLHQTGVNLD